MAFRLADGLRVDVHGAANPEASADDAARRFVAACRLWNRQWWLTRGASESLTELSASFVADGLGQPTGNAFEAVRHVAPWLGTERLLDDESQRVCLQFIARQTDIPFSLSALLDSVWCSVQEDMPAAVLNAAIACESALADEARASARANGTMRLFHQMKRQDFKVRLDRGAKAVLGRSFREDDAVSYDRLTKVWLARQGLAHGSSVPARRAFARITFREALLGAFAFFEWLSALRPRDPLEPMAAVAHPLYRRPV